MLLPVKETNTCTFTQYLEGEVGWTGKEKEIFPSHLATGSLSLSAHVLALLNALYRPTLDMEFQSQRSDKNIVQPSWVSWIRCHRVLQAEE